MYRIDLVAHCAALRVYRRPDLSPEAGANEAEAVRDAVLRLASDPDVDGLTLDLREAPPAVGPRTVGVFRAMLSSFEQVQKRVAVVLGASGTQRMQWLGILELPGRQARCFETMAEGKVFVRRQPADR